MIVWSNLFEKNEKMKNEGSSHFNLQLLRYDVQNIFYLWEKL